MTPTTSRDRGSSLALESFAFGPATLASCLQASLVPHTGTNRLRAAGGRAAARAGHLFSRSGAGQRAGLAVSDLTTITSISSAPRMTATVAGPINGPT